MAFEQFCSLTGRRLPALVLFDLDGTLVDSVPDIAHALDQALLASGHAAVGEARVRGWVGRGSRILARDALATLHGKEPAAADVDALLAAYLERYREDCTRLTRAMPGAEVLLDALVAHGVPLACVTNKPERIAARVLRHVFPDTHFAMLVGGDSGLGVKPEPGPLEAVLRKLGVPVQDALLIGDSRHDVHAARAAGMAVACVANGYNHGEDVGRERPDLLVQSLFELL